MREDITERICRDELLGLLETTAPRELQRITREMPVVVLADLLQDSAPEPPPGVVVTFR